jgi:hypothetical protein
VTSFRSQLLDGDETAHVQPGSGAHFEVAADRFPKRADGKRPVSAPRSSTCGNLSRPTPICAGQFRSWELTGRSSYVTGGGRALMPAPCE